MASLSCATAPQVTFGSMEELKAHYKSDWHRYNLKRKARCLGAAPRSAPAHERRRWLAFPWLAESSLSVL